jgi:hypothetical protein
MARLRGGAGVLEDAPETPDARVRRMGADKIELLPAPELAMAEVGRAF